MTGVQTCALPICFPVTIPGQIVFKNQGEDVVRYNCDRYNNKLKNGYNVVWKSSMMFMEEGIDVVWKNIVERSVEVEGCNDLCKENRKLRAKLGLGDCEEID